MEFVTIITAILIVDLLALVSPGPNFVLVTSSALSNSRRHALWTGMGIATGSLVWASAAALGIASVLENLPVLAFVLRAAGIGYLIYLGIRLLRSNGFQPSASPVAAARGVSGFWRGFFVNMTNPKSAAYYASVFAAFLTPQMPSWVLITLVTAIAAMSLLWHAVLAFGFSAPAVQTRYVAVSRYVDRACGGFLVFLGLRLAWESR